MSHSSHLSPVVITKIFSRLPDPRRRGKVTHPLINVVIMSICAVVAGADNATEIARFARARREWFGRLLDLRTGIPSHDTFSRVLQALNPVAFQKCLLAWFAAVHEITAGEIIAIDGKVAREAMARSGNQGGMTLVSAWATKNQLCLGQAAGTAGSNELEAIPRLLELLELHGAIVTLDALACQKHIVEQIVNQNGSYVIAVKGNQEKLEEVVRCTIAEAYEQETVEKEHERHESGHGREELRMCVVVEAPEFEEKEEWKGIKTFAMVVREYTDSKGKLCEGTRFYISNLPLKRSAILFEAVRAHWSVENQLHWSIDVTFGEDTSRARLQNAQANMGILRRMALSLLKNAKNIEGSIVVKRKAAGWDENVMNEILFKRESGKS